MTMSKSLSATLDGRIGEHVSLLRLNGSTLMRLAMLGSLLVVITHGLCSLLPTRTTSALRAPFVMTGSASPAQEREVDEWLPVSLSCRRTERFGSSR